MSDQGIIKEYRRIKEITKLSSQDFITIEYESGERKVIKRKK